MIRGKKNLIEYFRICGNPYWTIYPTNLKNGNPIAKSPEEDSYSLEQSEEDLSKALDILATGNTYLITLKKEKSLTKGYTETKYDHFDQVASTHPVHQPTIGSTNISDFQKQIEELAEIKTKQALEDQRKEQQILVLEESIIELKKELKTNKAGRLESLIMNVIDKNPIILQALMTWISPKKVGIAGFDTKTNNQHKTMHNKITNENIESDDQVVLEESLERWSEADPNFLVILEKISLLAANKPDQYNKYKPLLEAL